MKKSGGPQWPPDGLSLPRCRAGCPPGLLPSFQGCGPLQPEEAFRLHAAAGVSETPSTHPYSSATCRLPWAGLRKQQGQAKRRGTPYLQLGLNLSRFPPG